MRGRIIVAALAVALLGAGAGGVMATSPGSGDATPSATAQYPTPHCNPQGQDCHCPGNFQYDPGTKTCQCPSGATFDTQKNQCQCPPGEHFGDAQSPGCQCPNNQTLQNGRCVAAPHCDAQGQSCHCPDHFQDVSGQCECPGGSTVAPDGNSCQCPPGEHFDNSSPPACTSCPGDQAAQNDRCVAAPHCDPQGNCRCPDHFQDVNAQCECPDGSSVAPDGNSCQCPPREHFTKHDAAPACQCPGADTQDTTCQAAPAGSAAQTDISWRRGGGVARSSLLT